MALAAAALAAALSAGCGGAVPPASAAILVSGHQAYQRGDDRATIARMTRFCRMHPKAQEAGEACYIRGLARCRMGDRRGGEQDFQRAVDLTRRGDVAGRAHLALAQLAEGAGRPQGAQEQYLAPLKALPPRMPPADAALFRLACLLQRGGRWTEADQRFDRLLFLFGRGRWAAAARRRIRGRSWTIQTGAFRRRANADRQRALLRSAGHAARIAAVGRTPVLLAVQVGRYGTYTAAEAALPGVRRQVGEAVIAIAR